jgi:Domain of unknown function (DUF4214)
MRNKSAERSRLFLSAVLAVLCFSAIVWPRGVLSQPSSLDPTTEFVKQQYRDFLNREAEPGGLQFWVNQIDTGAMTKSQVISAFLHSQEFEGRIAPIVRLYFAYFLRIPDYEGLQYWINQYTNGAPLALISEAFADSQEFQQRYGSLNDGDFVTLLYQNVLGRSPDAGGYAYWVGQLNSGLQTRGRVMLGFSDSQEYKALIRSEILVTMTYVGMLRRSPEQGGFDYWVGYLDSGNSELALIDGFLNSQEYANRFLAFLDWGRYYDLIEISAETTRTFAFTLNTAGLTGVHVEAIGRTLTSYAEATFAIPTPVDKSFSQPIIGWDMGMVLTLYAGGTIPTPTLPTGTYLLQITATRDTTVRIICNFY